MRDLQKFLKTTGIYLIGNILIKVAQLIMLPLYTKYLNPDDYGTFDLHVAYITFLSSILFFDIWGGILRFSFDYEKIGDKAKAVTCGSVIFGISVGMYTIFVFGMGTIFNIPHIGWLYAYGVLMNGAQVCGCVARALGKNFVYALGGLCGTLVNLICNFIFITVFHKGYEYIYISYCIGMIINVAVIGRGCRIWILLKVTYFERNLFRDMFWFGIPLSLNSAAYWFLTSYNKVVVSQYLDAAQNGIYAVAMKFSAMLQLVTQCFQMAWQEITFSKARKSREEMNIFYTKAVNEYIKFMGVGMLMMIPIIKLVFPVMVDLAYCEAEKLIPFVMLGAWFSCISSFLASILSTIKKNKMVCTTTIIGSVVSVLLVHLMIVKIGIYAAVLAFASGFATVVVRRICMVNKYITVKINFRQLVFLVGGFLVVTFIYIKGCLWINLLVIVVIGIIVLFNYRGIVGEMFRKVRGYLK